MARGFCTNGNILLLGLWSFCYLNEVSAGHILSQYMLLAWKQAQLVPPGQVSLS